SWSGMGAVIFRCLAKDRSRRYPRAGDLADALRRLGDEAPETRPRKDSRIATSVSPVIGVPGFVGREKELDELRGRLDAASSGEAQLVLISGEIGVGKSC